MRLQLICYQNHFFVIIIFLCSVLANFVCDKSCRGDLVYIYRTKVKTLHYNIFYDKVVDKQY